MRLRSDLTLRKIGGEYMIVEPEKGVIDLSKVYALNDTAAFLWNKLNGKDFTENDMAHLLVEEYGLSPYVAAVDVAKLLEKFRTENLLG